ncbi:MAG: hypothetical protein GY715_07045 [Planctomycetes bacterium]|nr:hypothetical protein [Planctomycetota bacterium]
MTWITKMSCGLAAVLAGLALSPCTFAGGTPTDVIMAPQYKNAYVPFDLGEMQGVTGPLGGIAFAPGDPDTLLVADNATDATAAVYAVPLMRNECGCIVGYAGPAVAYATTPFIDGGLTHGPADVLLYTTYDGNTLGQIRSGSTSADRVIDLTALSVAPSTGTMAVVPAGMPGAGRLKIASFDASAWYDAVLVDDGAGTFDVTSVTPLAGSVGPGPEGIVYVPAGHPLFPDGGVLVTKWSAFRVDAYDVDAVGDPVIATERIFVEQLSGAEGACMDPVSGDFVFSTLWFLDRVVVIRAKGECAADLAPPGGNGTVDFGDYLALLSQFGQSCTPADLNLDGAVDFGDVFVLFGSWGPCP